MIASGVLALALLVSDEFPIDHAQGDLPAALPVVDFDGTNYFVAWLDGRRRALCGARVSPAGVVIDKSGIVIDAGLVNEPLGIAWNGSHHLLVVGAPYQRTGYLLSASGDIAATVSAMSASWDSGPVAVSSDGNGNFLVVSPTSPYDVGASLVTDAGTVMPLSFPSTYFQRHGPVAAAFDGTSFVAGFRFWDGQFHAARFDTTGTLLDASDIILSTTVSYDLQYGTPHSFVMAGDGAGTLAAWNDVGVDAVRIDLTGKVVDTTPIHLTDHRPSVLALAYDASSWVLGWQSSGTRRASRISTGGSLLDSLEGTSLGSGTGEGVGIAASSGTGLLAWAGSLSGTASTAQVGDSRPLDIQRWLSSPPGTDGTAISIAGSSGTHDAPAVAVGSGVALAAWAGTDWTSPSEYADRVAAAIVDSSGTVAAPILLTASAEASSPAAAFDGTGFVTTWWETSGSGGRLVARSVSTAGAMSGRTTLVDGVLRQAAKLASSNGTTLVVYEHYSVYGVTYAHGAVGAPHRLFEPDDAALVAEKSPAVAWDGTSFVVASLYSAGAEHGIRFGRFDLGGAPLDAPFSLVRADVIDDLALACHEGACVLVWRTAGQAVAARLEGATLTSETTVATGLTDARPLVAFEGADCLVAIRTDVGADLVTLHADGSFDTTPLVATPGSLADVAFAGDGSKTALVYATAYANGALFGRTLSEPAPPPVSDAGGPPPPQYVVGGGCDCTAAGDASGTSLFALGLAALLRARRSRGRAR